MMIHPLHIAGNLPIKVFFLILCPYLKRSRIGLSFSVVGMGAWLVQQVLTNNQAVVMWELEMMNS